MGLGQWTLLPKEHPCLACRKGLSSYMAPSSTSIAIEHQQIYSLLSKEFSKAEHDHFFICWLYKLGSEAVMQESAKRVAEGLKGVGHSIPSASIIGYI